MDPLLKGESKKKKLAAAILIPAVLLLLFSNLFAPVRNAAAKIMRVAAPVVWGLCLAFVLNLPMSFFENRMLKGLKAKKPGLARALAIVLSYAIFLGSAALVVALVAPKVADSVIMLTENLGTYAAEITDRLDRWSAGLKLSPEAYELIAGCTDKIMTKVNDFAADNAPQLLKMTVSAVTVVYDVLITLVISIHGLIRKEKLIGFMKRTAAAVIPERHREGFFGYCAYANRTFKRYIAGQTASCVILGLLCYIGMRIFNMPYAELIAVFLSVAAFIPIIGPWVSTICCALIILVARIDDPWLALWFVLIVVAVQLVDDNVIAPRVVGDAIGVPGMLVIAAIVLAGGLFGIGGLLVAVPSAAVGYKVFNDWINGKSGVRSEE
ncbi:MAG: AI-2E family transporter [Clostridiales bacterium]|nr:AI-2E family transporter [Clostridiales bacterium]